MANGYLRAVFESEPGNEHNTPTLSTKVIYEPIQSFEVQSGSQPLMRDDELRNIDEPIAALPETYDPTWSLTTRAYPDLIGFELKQILGAPTTAAGDGVITDPDGNVVATGAYLHVWEAPYGPPGPYPLTSQRHISYTDENYFLRETGCGATQLQLSSPQQGGVVLTANGPALFLERLPADPGYSPAYESLTVPPFLRANCSIVSWLTGTAVTEDITVTIDNQLDQVHTLSNASGFPNLIEKGDPPIAVSGSIPKRHINDEDWDAMMSLEGFSVHIKWVSDAMIGATSNEYALHYQSPHTQYMTGGPEALANKRRHGATFDWKSTYNGTPGSSKFSLVNATASYV